jgi:NitT/TauT family transport system substrate-binding protein
MVWKLSISASKVQVPPVRYLLIRSEILGECAHHIEDRQMNNCHCKACSFFIAIMVAVILVSQANELALAQLKDDISIGYASPSGMFTPLFIAQERALFKKYGLAVKELLLLRGTGPAAAQMLVAGTAPIAGLGGALVEAGMHGGGLVYVASMSNQLIFSLYSRPEIARPEDLRGKTVAVDAKGGSIELATIVALKHFGLAVGKDVTEVYLGGPVSQLGALEKGIVDAATLSAPTTLKAKSMGLKELINIGALKLNYIHAAIGVNRAFAKNNPEMIDAFLKAYIEAIKMMREEPELARQAIAKYTGINEPDALKVTYETFLPAFQQRVPYVLRDSVQGVLNFSTSPEAKSQRAEDFIDDSFLQKIEASSFVKKLYGVAKP